jgi:hypothetical protein
MKQAFPDATIIGADVVREPLYRLAEDVPSVPLLRFDLLKCPLPDAAVDALVMLNVLEHIEDDLGALSRRVASSSRGLLILEVPAGPGLYDAYDAALRHFRRYSTRELSGKLHSTEFNIIVVRIKDFSSIRVCVCEVSQSAAERCGADQTALLRNNIRAPPVAD